MAKEFETHFFVVVDADFHFEQKGSSSKMVLALRAAAADVALPAPDKDLHWLVVLHQCQVNTYGERHNIHTVTSKRILAPSPTAAVEIFIRDVFGA